MTDKPGPGKFEANESEVLSEELYKITMEDGCDETIGDGHWFGIIRNIDKPNMEAFLVSELHHDIEVNWHYIVDEDEQGFFTYKGYNDLDEVNAEWAKIMEAESGRIE